jgi:hypothetical protein
VLEPLPARRTQDLNLAHVEAAAGEVGDRGVHVGDHELQAGGGAGRLSVSPLPITIEQAEPGGVSCTTRTSSLICVS